MKTLYKLLGLFFISSFLMITACEDTDESYTGPIQVQFTNNEGTFYVLDQEISTYDVEIMLVGQQQDVDKQVTFEVLDYTIISGDTVYTTIDVGTGADIPSYTTTIKAGESFASFSIEGIYDDLIIGETETLVLALAGGDLEAASFNNVYVLGVQAYYPYVQSEFVGHWSGYFYNDINGYEAIPTSPGLTIVAGTDPHVLVITEGLYQEQIDSWGETWTDGPYSVELYMDDSDPTNFTVEYNGFQYIGTTNDTWDYEVDAYPTAGTFNAATKEMTIYGYGYVYETSLNDIFYYKISLDSKGGEKGDLLPIIPLKESIKRVK